jgi:hypothetical protein
MVELKGEDTSLAGELGCEGALEDGSTWKSATRGHHIPIKKKIKEDRRKEKKKGTPML